MAVTKEYICRHIIENRVTVSIEKVAEIVRCKDCKYATDDDVDTTRFWCGYKWPAYMVPGDGYCFRGDHK